MHPNFLPRVARTFSGLVFSLALAGCFGTGEGPEQIAGTPAPPAPPSACDPLSAAADGLPFPLNFENLPGGYDFGPMAGFGGGVALVIDNPVCSAENPTPQVVEMRKFAAELFGGANLALNQPVDFAQGTVFTMKVWSQRPVPVTFKFENSVTNQPADGIEEIETHSGSSEWETLCFDFSAQTTIPTDSITFIFDNGVLGDADNNPDDWTFYFDGIEQTDACPGAPTTTLPVDFEDDPATYQFGDFDGGAADVITNPDQSGINATAQTARMIKDGGEVFGGSTLALGGLVDFAQGTAFTMKVWSNRGSAVPVLFKFEDAVTGLPQNGIEDEQTHTGGGTWEELCFDFAGSTAGFSTEAITFIFDNGTVGDATNNPDAWTFYFDEIEQVASCAGAPPPSSLPTVDFESAATGAGFTWDVFENGDNPPLQIIANPDQSGANTSATVAEFTARVAGQPFAGTVTQDLPTFTLDASNAIVKIKVWKPVISNVGIKFERADNASTGEILVANTVTNQWEELTFDFSAVIGNPANTDITKVVIFPDFDTRAQENVIYFDDLSFGDGSGGGGGGGGTSAPPSIDFESGSFTVDDFDGGAHAFVANPDPGGLNTSANVLQLQKFPGATFAGNTLQLGGDIDFSNGEAYQVLVYSTRSVDVLFKLEGLNIEGTVTHGGTGWELLCYDFTGQTGGTPSSAITFIFDNGTVGAADTDPDNWTFYVDDIEQVSSCGGGGGGGTGGLPVVDFESAATGAGFTWSVFENVDNPPLQIITNPDQSGANTSATVAEFTARQAGQPFAGTITTDLPTFTLDSSNAIVKIKVWKPVISNVGIKFENATGGSTGEILVANTVTNQWEELTFDFTGVIGDPNNTDITGLVIFPDFDTRTQENVIYFDDLSFGSGSGGPPASVLPIDFEASPASYTFGDFNGGVGDVVANPEVGTDNPSAQVARMQKFDGATFGGTTLDLGGTFDLPAGSAFTMKVRATRAVPVLFKLEGGPVGEVEVNHGGTGWEVLCFDFDGVAAGNGTSGITFIFDNGTVGAAATDPDNWTFYFDDIELVADCPAAPPTGLPTVDFESASTGAGFTWSVFENVDNPPLQIITNPDQSGANTSATVAEFTARLGGQPFAGTITSDLPTFTLDASNAIVKIKVWKPVISNVGIKFENGVGGSTGEILVANTVTNQWEELTFDFTGVIGDPNNTDITGLVIFPDFDTRSQENVIYFDDISFGDGT